ncbi:small nucleolar ribonucleo protein-like protein complex subunit [Clathrospora elynae]|uniref:Small nucleolar ribonucleo protein-like protein complex subunit n=1 Tax=Clathrospora elynae TaxID=706981 RepID=A0A6A5SKQ2_9PLEO|nr:small nucleolar ribonucleo protein-like protein complex subunit [Clathrospora elynae]
MDIHRARFVPYQPSAINALAFSHSEAEHGQQDPASLRLAIGRANGNIEIWNPAKGAWLQEKVFHGGKDRSVEGLVWTQEPDQRDAHDKILPGRLRLFSIGYSSSVTEWDLTTGLPARHSNGNHSEVWCFAAQPRQKNTAKVTSNEGSHAHQKLVAGCADGTIVLLSTEDNDLTFERFVSRATNKKARALSVTYKDQNTVLAGFADSMIRVFDTRNGIVIRNISLGSGPNGGPKDILVWKVKCLSNGDFVSGDSTGDIRIYSGKNFSQIQRISGHEADVLDLAVSRDGSSIFSAGMDRRTCFYTSKKGQSQGQNGKWRKVSHQRHHEHDVKALATYEGSKLSVVVSGGIDTQPVVVPLRQFGKELTRSLPALPPTPPLTSAPDARLLVSWWNTEVRIWRVKPQDDGTEKPKVVARLALQGEENITSVSISQDGGLLAVATASVVKLFQLLHSQPGAGAGLRVRKLEMPSIAGANIVKLAATGKWLAALTASGDVELVRIVRTDDPTDSPRALDKLQPLHRLHRDATIQSPLNGLSGSYERSIIHADFSRDGNVFAVVDLAGYVDTWVIEGHEDSTAPEIDIDDSISVAEESDESDDEEEAELQITFLGQQWIRNPSGHLLPRLDSTPVLLSFQPISDDSSRPEPNGNPAVHPTRHNPHPHSHDLPTVQYRLMVVSAEHQLYLFDVMSGRLSEWSRRNPPSCYPREYRQLDLPAKGCIWDVAESQQRIWLYGEKWLFMFDLTKDFPISGLEHAGKKRKLDVLTSNSGAGDAVPQKEMPVTKMRKFQTDEKDQSGKQKWIDVNAIGRGTNQDDDDVEDAGQPLATLRRSTMQDGEHTNGVLTNGVSEEEVNGGEVGEVDQRKRNEPWWHTLKYRPILGIVPISGDDSFHAPEVVLVERPSWDLDLPPRFIGMHEQ